ncbi:hypothetical protein AVEN_218038-1 [Araneus ventricosus]|uniref:Uncharacterized protein n=1 Tax=Araneus ventricosus TaxID=182803 RepID=A0A4Y2LWP8_ARAVE|nr:hypothetical protein AVEN_218038-1 [Araneus ventricosus]
MKRDLTLYRRCIKSLELDVLAIAGVGIYIAPARLTLPHQVSSFWRVVSEVRCGWIPPDRHKKAGYQFLAGKGGSATHLSQVRKRCTESSVSHGAPFLVVSTL